MALESNKTISGIKIWLTDCKEILSSIYLTNLIFAIKEKELKNQQKKAI